MRTLALLFTAMLLLCALPAMADGIDNVSVSNATFTGQCTSGPCTETFNLSFDISANIDWMTAMTAPLTNSVDNATGFLGQFSSPSVAVIDKGYIGFGDGLGDEVDLDSWGPAGYSGPARLTLYACRSAACIDAFSFVPGAFIQEVPNGPFVYVSDWIGSTGGTMNVTNVPEPSGFLLLGVGLLAAFSWKRRVRHAGKATRIALA